MKHSGGCCCVVAGFIYSPVFTNGLLCGTSLITGINSLTCNHYSILTLSYIVPFVQSLIGLELQANTGVGEGLMTVYKGSLALLSTTIWPCALLTTELLYNQRNVVPIENNFILAIPWVIAIAPIGLTLVAPASFECAKCIVDFCVFAEIAALYYAADMVANDYKYILAVIFTFDHIINRLIFHYDVPKEKGNKLNFLNVKLSAVNMITFLCFQSLPLLN